MHGSVWVRPDAKSLPSIIPRDSPASGLRQRVATDDMHPCAVPFNFPSSASTPGGFGWNTLRPKADFDRMESACRMGKGALLSLSKGARRAHQSTAFGGHASL